MNDHQKLAKDLITSLELSLPPIAVSFCDVPPANVPFYDGVVPAGCVFWQEAATRTFVTSAKDHELRDRRAHAPFIRGFGYAANRASRSPQGDGWTGLCARRGSRGDPGSPA